MFQISLGGELSVISWNQMICLFVWILRKIRSKNRLEMNFYTNPSDSEKLNVHNGRHCLYNPRPRAINKLELLIQRNKLLCLLDNQEDFPQECPWPLSSKSALDNVPAETKTMIEAEIIQLKVHLCQKESENANLVQVYEDETL